MKNQYKNVDILLSMNNIQMQQEKIKNIILSLENQYEFDLDYTKWKCSAKDQFIKVIVYLKKLLINLDEKMNSAKKALDMINKIQIIVKEIENLERENEMLKNSMNPNDILKISQNNIIIEGNREYIERLENNITTLGW